MKKIISLFCASIFTFYIMFNGIKIEVKAETKVSSMDKQDKPKSDEEPKEKQVEEITENDVKTESFFASEDYSSFKLSSNKTYELTNTSAYSITIKYMRVTGNGRYNYIDYYYNGSIRTLNRDVASGITIASGDKVRFSAAAGNEVSLSILSQYKDLIKETSTPVFYEYEMVKDKGYELTNNINNDIRVLREDIFNNSSKYDYVYYNNLGDVYDLNTNMSIDINIKSGYKKRISLRTGNALKLYIPYENKDIIKEVDRPAIWDSNIEKDKSYEISNNTGNFTKILSDTISSSNNKYDYVYYNQSGSISETRIYEQGNIDIAKGCRKRISLSSGYNSRIYMPYELKDMMKEVDTPAVFKFVATSSVSYEINNNIGKAFKVLNNGDYRKNYDYIDYDSAGKITSLDTQKYENFIVENGHKKRVSLSQGSEITLFVPYEYKDTVKEVQTPAFYKVTATADKSYEINNSTDKSISVLNDNDYNKRYEYIDYDKTGEIAKQVVGGYDNFAVESDHKRRISLNKGTSITLYVPYEYKDTVKESQSPAFYKVIATKDKSYEINNNVGKKVCVSTDNEYGNKYEYVDYDGTGKIAKQVYGEYNDFIVENGHKKIVSLNSGADIKLYIPYEYKSAVKEAQNPAFSKFVVSKNVSLEITNSSDEALELLNTSNYSTKYNYINYNENNKIGKIARDQDGIISISGKNKKKICSSDNRNIVIYVPYDKSKNAKIINEPVFQELLLQQGKNYEIENNTDDIFISLVKNIANTTSSYDFIDFDSNSKITKVERDKEKIDNIEPHHKIRMSPSKGNGLKLYIPYENRNMIREVSTPVFYQFNLEKNKTYEVINKTGIGVTMYSDSEKLGVKYDFIRYDENGDVVCSLKDTYGNFNAVNNQREKISMSQGENSILYIPYEMKDIIKPTDIPVFYEKHIEKGKSYEIVNNEDKSIKVLKNRTDNNYYEFIEYNENGDMEKYSSESGDLIIDGKHKDRFNIKTGEEFNLYLPYEYKDIIKDASMPLYYEINVSKGEQCVIKNNSDHLLYFATSSSSSDAYFVSVYDGPTESIKRISGTDSNTTSVKANGSIVVNGIKAQTVTLKVPYEAMGFDEKYEKEDLNKDGQVDMLDLAMEGNSYNRTYRDKEWIDKEDVNFDGIIDIYDIVRVSKKVS